MENIITEAELLSAVKEKRIPTLRNDVSQADLSLQEVEIVNAMKTCDSLGKVSELIDKFTLYIAMSKVEG